MKALIELQNLLRALAIKTKDTHEVAIYQFVLYAAATWAIASEDDNVVRWRTAAVLETLHTLKLNKNTLIAGTPPTALELQRERLQRECLAFVKRIGQRPKLLSQRDRVASDKIALVIILCTDRRDKVPLDEFKRLGKKLAIQNCDRMRKGRLADEILGVLNHVHPETVNRN